MKFIAILLAISGVIIGIYWYSNPIKTEQYNIIDREILNATCYWSEPYMVPMPQTIGNVTTIVLQTYYNTYQGYQNQIVRYWTEKNTYRNGEVKVTEHAQVVQQLTNCHN